MGVAGYYAHSPAPSQVWITTFYFFSRPANMLHNTANKAHQRSFVSSIDAALFLYMHS